MNFFSFILGFETDLAVLRGHSWLYAQEFLWTLLGRLTWFSKDRTELATCKQVPICCTISSIPENDDICLKNERIQRSKGSTGKIPMGSDLYLKGLTSEFIQLGSLYIASI